jgi:hypothetical protein
MKKILITGMNAAQCKRDYFLQQELQVVPSHYALIRCLEDMGYEVEQRAVELGEDLSKYDDVIVYMHSIQAFCQRLFGGLYAIAARPDCILAFDDWQVDQIYRSFDDYLGDLEKWQPGSSDTTGAFRVYLLSLYQGNESKNTIESYKDMYIDACKIALSKKNRLLISAFDKGDLGLLKLEWDPTRVYRFNPNPYHLNRAPTNGYGEEGLSIFTDDVIRPEDKIREWNFASLVQKKTKKWLQQQNIKKWKINYYGARRGEEVKQARLTEADMCRVYASQWGCLMPGYFHSGSGWWRARPLQVADVGSILVCDEHEGKVYGEAYNIKASDVEEMNLEELIRTARFQKECLYDNHPLDRSVTRAELNTILGADK